VTLALEPMLTDIKSPMREKLFATKADGTKLMVHIPEQTVSRMRMTACVQDGATLLIRGLERPDSTDPGQADRAKKSRKGERMEIVLLVRPKVQGKKTVRGAGKPPATRPTGDSSAKKMTIIDVHDGRVRIQSGDNTLEAAKIVLDRGNVIRASDRVEYDGR